MGLRTSELQGATKLLSDIEPSPTRATRGETEGLPSIATGVGALWALIKIYIFYFLGGVHNPLKSPSPGHGIDL